MSLNQKRVILSVCVVVFLVSLVSAPVFGRAIWNFTETGFDEGSSQSSGIGQLNGNSIETYIIRGAGYFMRSYSDTLLVLNRIEMSDLEGVDFEQLRLMVDQAIEGMEITRDTYIQLNNKVNSTPYNPVMIGKLLVFDYQKFGVEKGLNGNIFKTVRNYLSEGDLRGAYAYFLSGVENILNNLNQVKQSVDTGNLPDNEVIWRLNQQFSEAQLFGQYVAEVFYRSSKALSIVEKDTTIQQ
ncbi:MAG: hypothetical protein GY940_02755 [bacterium]|nr:hypothetical protein [bacterium]